MRKRACQEIYFEILRDMILFCKKGPEAYLEPSGTSTVELSCENC